MRELIGTLMMELRKDGSLWFWASDRVPDCPHRACRRARQCMRPEPVQGVLDADWLSCPFVPDRVLEMLREGIEHAVLGPPSPEEKAMRALCEKHVKAAQSDRGLRR